MLLELKVTIIVMVFCLIAVIAIHLEESFIEILSEPFYWLADVYLYYIVDWRKRIKVNGERLSLINKRRFKGGK